MAVKLGKMSKFVKFEDGSDDKKIKAAVLQKMEDEAAAAMEGDEGYNYGASADRLEEMAKEYEDAQCQEEDGDAEPMHVAMRRYAAKFRKMGKGEEGAAAGGKDAGAGADDGEKMAAEKLERAKVRELTAFAQRLGLAKTEGMSSKQLMDAIEASAVPSSKIGAIVDERVKKAIAEEQQKATAKTYEQKAVELLEQAKGMPANQKEAVKRLASDPQHFEAAVGIVENYMRSTGVSIPDPTVLFGRLTAGGSPIAGLSGTTTRTQAPTAGSDARIVKMDVLGTRALVTGEKLSQATNELADSVDPALKAKVDRELEPGMAGTKYERFGRYQAAERILKKEQPALFEAAKTDELRIY